MLPNLRTILAAMALTAILVTLVGTALMPVPGDPYIRSAGFPRVGQPLVQQAQVENPEWQQLHMLGYARRADELNRLLALSQLPAPISGELPGALDGLDGGSSSYAKQGGDAVDSATASPTLALAPTQPARNPDEQRPDVAVTGSVNSSSAAKISDRATDGTVVNEPASSPVDPDPKIASTQSGPIETEAADSVSPFAPIAVLPPIAKPRPHALARRKNHAGRATTDGTATPSADANNASFSGTDRTVGASDRALSAAKAATAPTSTARPHVR
jgi:hypothetical protein